MFFIKNPIVKVTQKELENILLNSKSGATFCTIVQVTSPKTNKKCRDTKEPFTAKVQKITKLSVLINSDYKKGLETQLERENKPKTAYKKGENKMIIDKSMSKNNFSGKYYGKVVIEYRPYNNSYPTTKFVLNGKITNKTKIPNVLPKKYVAKNQGTSKEIFWRKLYVKNIAKISIDGVTYKNINCKIV